MAKKVNKSSATNPVATRKKVVKKSAKKTIQGKEKEQHPPSGPPVDANSKEYQQKMFAERYKLFMNEFSQLLDKHDIGIGFAYVYDHTLKTPLVYEKGHPADLLKEVTYLETFFRSNFDVWLRESN